MYSTALALRTKDSFYYRRHACLSGDLRVAEGGACCGNRCLLGSSRPSCSWAGVPCCSTSASSRFIYSFWLGPTALIRWVPSRIVSCDGGGRATARYARLSAVWNGDPCPSAVRSKRPCCDARRIAHRIRASDEIYQDMPGLLDEIEECSDIDANAATYDVFDDSYAEQQNKRNLHDEKFRGRYRSRMDSAGKNVRSARTSNLNFTDQNSFRFSSSSAEAGNSKLQQRQERAESSSYYALNGKTAEKEEWRSEKDSSSRRRFYASDGKVRSQTEAEKREERKRDIQDRTTLSQSSDHRSRENYFQDDRLVVGKESKEEQKKISKISTVQESNSKETNFGSKKVLSSVTKEEASSADLLGELRRQRTEIEQLRKDYQELLRMKKIEEINAVTASSSSTISHTKAEEQEERSSWQLILLEEIRRQRVEMEQLNASCQKLMSTVKTEESNEVRQSSSSKSYRKDLDGREETFISAANYVEEEVSRRKDHKETDVERYADEKEKVSTSTAYINREDQKHSAPVVRDEQKSQLTHSAKVNVQKEDTTTAVNFVDERRTQVMNTDEKVISLRETTSRTQNRVESAVKDREEVSTSVQHLIEMEREKRVQDDHRVTVEVNVRGEAQGQRGAPDVYIISAADQEQIPIPPAKANLTGQAQHPRKREKKKTTLQRASELVKDQTSVVYDSQLSSETRAKDDDSLLLLLQEGKGRWKSPASSGPSDSQIDESQPSTVSASLEARINKGQSLFPHGQPSPERVSSQSTKDESQPSPFPVEESQLSTEIQIHASQPSPSQGQPSTAVVSSQSSVERFSSQSEEEKSKPSLFLIEKNVLSLSLSQPSTSRVSSESRIDESLLPPLKVEESQPSPPLSQPSTSRVSSWITVEVSQPSPHLNQPSTAEVSSEFLIEESQQSFLQIEESQPAPPQDQPFTARVSSESLVDEGQRASLLAEESQLSPPQSQPSTESLIGEGRHTSLPVEGSHLPPPWGQPSTARVPSDSLINEGQRTSCQAEQSQPPIFLVEEIQSSPPPSRPYAMRAESLIDEGPCASLQAEESQLPFLLTEERQSSSPPSQLYAARAESLVDEGQRASLQAEESQLPSLLTEERQSSSRPSQPYAARAEYLTDEGKHASLEAEESQPPLLLIEERQWLPPLSRPFASRAESLIDEGQHASLRTEESQQPSLLIEESQLLSPLSQPSLARVSEYLIDESQRPSLQLEKSQISSPFTLQSEPSTVSVSSQVEESQRQPLQAEESQPSNAPATLTAGGSITKRSGKSLWGYVADIFRIGWRTRDDPQKSTIKSEPKSSSNESVSSDAWYSGHEIENDEEENPQKGRTASARTEPSKSAADDDQAPLIEGVPPERTESEEIREKEGEGESRGVGPMMNRGKLLRRTKQVKREEFEEWEDAYKLEAEERKMDEFFMREALAEAKKAADMWEVPVGAVLVQDGKIIAKGCNLVEDLRDSTAHAEMICIREASSLLRTWRLAGTTLYVTLEPCAMCAGAILQARIDTIVWGAPNKLLGADGSWIRLFPGEEGREGPVHPFHPKMKVRRGVLATECADAMQQFFQLRRKKNKAEPPPPPPPPPPRSLINYPAKVLTKMQNIFCLMTCM